jgi:ubiquinol-cytochrome c reductase cytochrome c subunit
MTLFRSLAVLGAIAVTALPLLTSAQTTAPGAPVAPAAGASSAPAGDATRGKADFLSYGCYECHGTQGQGNYGTAPKLAPHPLPYNAIIAYIRRPAGLMPSYAAVILPDKDVADIYAYLSSIPAGKSASGIPALSGVTTTPK